MWTQSVGWVRVPFDRSGMSSSPWFCSSRAIIYSPSSSFQSLSAMLILHLNITLRMFLDFFVNFVNKRTCLGGHWESTIELVFPWPLSVNLPVSVNLRSCPIIPRSPLWGSNRRQCSPNCLFLPHSHSLPQGWTRPRTLTIVGCRTIHRVFGRSTFPLKLDGDDDNDVEGGGGCGVLSEDERTEYRRRVLTPKTAGRRRKRGEGGLQIVRLGTEDGANQTIKDGFHKLNNS